ncbi:MAG: hypothetical protein OCD00_12170 [Colwellia sp.]
MKKVRIYQLIAIAIPFAFFALLEGGLRFFDYGRTVALFMENPAAPQYLLPRPDVVKRYFPKDSPVPSVTIETNFFLKEKPAPTQNGSAVRIFVQGGSTAAGFPFGYGASIAGMLDYRLKQTFPERSVEVINTALAAVNSYTILDFTDEIIAQQPDAVLIYAGHNEYLGILGVGSAYTAANSQAATLLYLKLKELRIFQLLQNAYWQFTKVSTSDNAPLANKQARTFMAKVAKHKNIPLGSDLYKQGLVQFETNISLVIAKYQAAGIPVLLSSVGSNLADQKPFSSQKLPTKLAKVLTEKYTTTNMHEISDDAVDELLQIAKQNNSADLYYQAGKTFVEKEQYTQAKQAFILARDHDLLRFRAPSDMNQLIAELATKQQVYFVDANKALEQIAEHNIIGKSLMLEHLHPTIKGYFAIADSFYQVLKQTKILGDFPVTISAAQAQKDLPIFAAEIYWGKAKIAGLMADYPFTDKPEKVNLPAVNNWSDKLGLAAYKKQATWLTIATENLKHAKNKNAVVYVKSAKLLADAMPFNAKHNYRAGVALIQFKQPEQAPRYLRRAIKYDSKNINSRLAISHAYIEQGKLSQALPYLESVLQLDPKNSTANNALPKIKAHLKLQTTKK